LPEEPIIAETASPVRPIPATGLKRFVFAVLGLFFVGCAYVGAITPGIPTTPFVLLASYFFSRSSPRLQRWLKRTPYFGRLLKEWDEHRGLRLSTKITATCIILPVATASLAFTNLPPLAKTAIAVLVVIGLGVIWLVLPTVSHTVLTRSSAIQGE
jgi:uncharacterized membrane protein YbaN (DUF454 family)